MTIDPVLRQFAGVLGLILACALVGVGAVWLGLRRRAPALAREVVLRYVSWLAIAVLVLGVLALGRTAWVVGVGALSLLAFREYARAVGLWGDPAFRGVAALCIVLLHAGAWWPSAGGSATPGWYGLFMAMPVYATLAILVVPVTRDEFGHMLPRMGLAILGVIGLGWLLGHLAYLVNLPGGVGLVLFLTFLVSVNDVAAFVVGKVAGRHRLRPRLSPGKTWEGAVGALLVTVGVAWLCRWLVPAYAPGPVAAVAALISLGAILGDLALSTLKRDLGIKDWGTVIPGHGGLLDRANSLVFSAPLFFHASRYFCA